MESGSERKSKGGGITKKNARYLEKTTPPEGDMKETEHTGLPLIYQLVTLIHIVLTR